MKREALTFLAVGLLTVGVDYLTYHGLMAFLAVPVAKMLGFMAGTLFAYVANRFLTFRSQGHIGRFIGLYALTLAINTGINSLVLGLFGPDSRTLAFLCATGASAVLNFVGMKFLVFKPVSKAVEGVR